MIGHIVSTVIKKPFSKRSQDPHIQIYGWTGLNCHYKTHRIKVNNTIKTAYLLHSTAVQLQDLPCTATHQHRAVISADIETQTCSR